MKVSIIDTIAAHYRLSIFSKLSNDSENNFHLFASEKSHNGVAIIDPELANTDPSLGGLKWTFISNIVIFKRIFWQKGVIRIVMNDDSDIFVFAGESHIISTWIAIAICKIRKIKVVLWGHGSYGNERFPKKNIRRFFNKLPDAYLLYNDRAKTLLIREGILNEKLFVINNSLNIDAHHQIRNSISDEEIKLLRKKLFPQSEELPTLLFIGRLTYEKKIEQLIQSIDILHKRGEKVNCIVVGSGEQALILKSLVSDLGLEKYVVFYGSCYDEKENAVIISLSDCCVSPGNIGLTAIHCMVFGTPVITHNDLCNQGPEASSVIENITGEYFVKDSIDNLVDKIIYLVFENGKNHYKNNCMKMVDQNYSPYYQIDVIRSMIKFLS